jgi:hypothetical protein
MLANHAVVNRAYKIAQIGSNINLKPFFLLQPMAVNETPN